MDLYRVSDGAYERNKLPLSRFDSWADVLQSISEILEIPVENAVCFGGDGRQLDEAVFHEVWEKGGGDLGEGGGVYVFDREAWSVQPEEWVRGLEEDVVLDIELPSESSDGRSEEKECTDKETSKGRTDPFGIQSVPFDPPTSLRKRSHPSSPPSHRYTNSQHGSTSSAPG